MTKFYICRHGETENNRAHRLQGWIDTPLTRQGVKDAYSSAAKLSSVKIDVIISSDLGRAFTSAYIISRRLGYTGEIRRAPELREVNYGELANQPYDTYPQLTPEEFAEYTPANGESYQAMQQRILSYVYRLADELDGRTALLVGHDGTINTIRSASTGETAAEADSVSNKHDYIAQFEVDQGKIGAFQEYSGSPD